VDVGVEAVGHRLAGDLVGPGRAGRLDDQRAEQAVRVRALLVATHVGDVGEQENTFFRAFPDISAAAAVRRGCRVGIVADLAAVRGVHVVFHALCVNSGASWKLVPEADDNAVAGVCAEHERPDQWVRLRQRVGLCQRVRERIGPLGPDPAERFLVF
jgi:hypothetical protein